ncbi:MAG: hypothetical protein OEM50_07410 [Gammaproteobacteria bacterium]|nr:hypothetical protein [Gammaproteobacteria bacterium]MDH3481531.1 hypothetical protein [Gammaproteobacteria bacterium]
MRLMLEFLEKEADRESLKSEIDEMEKIVISLLDAEQLSTRHVTLSRSPVKIGTLNPENPIGTAAVLYAGFRWT